MNDKQKIEILDKELNDWDYTRKGGMIRRSQLLFAKQFIETGDIQ